MPAHPPLSSLANATVASSGACHCYPKWHNFPVYMLRWQEPHKLCFLYKVNYLYYFQTFIWISLTYFEHIIFWY